MKYKKYNKYKKIVNICLQYTQEQQQNNDKRVIGIAQLC